MNIRIRTFLDPLFHGDDARGASVWAIAVAEGSLVTDGVLASGSDDRSASNAALAAFWKREDTKAQAESASRIVRGDDLSTFMFKNAQATAAETSNAGIRQLVSAAINSDPRDTLRIAYQDARGNYTSRLVVPSQIDGDLLTAYDVMRDDARTFRFDRIEGAEIVR